MFATAHELYHLWFENDGEGILKRDIEEMNNCDGISKNELKAKRFAAAFLINEELLLQEIRTYNVDKNKIDIKDIIKLSNLFIVPYKTMVKRLYEIKLINQRRYSKLMELYERKKITREKLEYLLELAGFTMKEMGIKDEEFYIPPKDEELDKIMEE